MRKLKAAHAEPEAKSPQTKSEEIDAMTKNIAFKDVNQGTALGALPLTLLVAQLCGQRYECRDGRAAYRWGMTMSEIDYHGGKAAVRRPRVREHRGAELELASWQAIKGRDLLSRWAFNQMLIGVATRKYARSVRLPEAIWQVVGRW